MSQGYMLCPHSHGLEHMSTWLMIFCVPNWYEKKKKKSKTCEFFKDLRANDYESITKYICKNHHQLLPQLISYVSTPPCPNHCDHSYSTVCIDHIHHRMPHWAPRRSCRARWIGWVWWPRVSELVDPGLWFLHFDLTPLDRPHVSQNHQDIISCHGVWW